MQSEKELTTAAKSKRIVKNTAMLYIRMLFVMAVSLYTSRIVLHALGEENYGIYNVVGGIIVMLGFFSGSLGGACSRFITFVLGKGDEAEVRKYYYDKKTNLAFIIEQNDRYIAATKTFLQEPEYREEYINSIGSALFLIFETDALTSREFRRRYGMYRKLIWKMKARSFQVRMLLYFSCLGFYRQVYWLLSLKRKIAGNHYFGR